MQQSPSFARESSPLVLKMAGKPARGVKAAFNRRLLCVRRSARDTALHPVTGERGWSGTVVSSITLQTRSERVVSSITLQTRSERGGGRLELSFLCILSSLHFLSFVCESHSWAPIHSHTYSVSTRCSFPLTTSREVAAGQADLMTYRADRGAPQLGATITLGLPHGDGGGLFDAAQRPCEEPDDKRSQ
jgi:hypothetical protein